MQTPPTSSSAPPTPEAILEWLQKEMNYPSPLPSPDQIRKICRGNMIPIWTFLLSRVRSERTVATARRNILVHGVSPAREEERRRRGGGSARGEGIDSVEAREAVARERDSAAEEATKARGTVRRQRRELRGKMAELAREETERRRMVDERANASFSTQNRVRHQQGGMRMFFSRRSSVISPAKPLSSCPTAGTLTFGSFLRNLCVFTNSVRPMSAHD